MSFSEEPQSLNLSNVNSNVKSLRYIHDFTSLIFGLSAGIMNLESYQGFIYFLFIFILINIVFILTICQSKPGLFFETPIKALFVDGLWASLTAFVMSWTLAYALVQG